MEASANCVNVINSKGETDGGTDVNMTLFTADRTMKTDGRTDSGSGSVHFRLKQKTPG